MSTKDEGLNVSPAIAKPMLPAVLSNLKAGDYIAFQWNYGTFGKEIIVDNINTMLGEFVWRLRSSWVLNFLKTS